MKRLALTTMAAAALGLAGCTQELVCPSDQLACGGACVAAATDPRNCGACGARCGPLGVCASGSCQCGPETTLCGGSCVDLASDPLNCGACGAACPAALLCTSTGGVATCAAACAAGQSSCDRACVDLFSSRYHCGACGRACGAGEHCAQGLCLADLYAACYNTDEVREAAGDLAPAGIPVATEAGPLALAWLGSSLFVANSLNNTVDELRFDPPAVRKQQVITIPTQGTYGPDLEYVAANAADGLLYVSNAAAGLLDVIDPVAGLVIDEVPLGAGTFPAGIAIVGTSAYVALNGTNEVAAVDISRAGTCPPDPNAPPCSAGACNAGRVCVSGSCQPAFCVAKRIALPAADLAGPNGSPMPSRLAAAGTLLYVTLWNLKPSDYTPAGSGRLAVIDTATNLLVTTPGSYPVDLGPGCANPGDIAAVGQTLYVSCGFFPYNDPSSLQGAAIVKVDLSTGAPLVGPELPLSGHAPGPLAFCGGAGYAGDRNAGSLFRFDPAFDPTNPPSMLLTGAATLCPPRAAGGSAYVADLTCSP